MLGNCLGSEKGPSSEAPKNYNRRWGGNICKYQLKSWKNFFFTRKKKKKKTLAFPQWNSKPQTDFQMHQSLHSLLVFFFFSFYSLLASSSSHTPHPPPPQRIPKGFKKPIYVLGYTCKPHTPWDRFHSPDFKTESSLIFFLFPFCFLWHLRYLEVTFILSLTHFFFSPNNKEISKWSILVLILLAGPFHQWRNIKKDTLTHAYHLNL